MRFSRSAGGGFLAAATALAAFVGSAPLHATPANKSAIEKHLGPLLADTMQNCAICHTHDHGTGLESLEEFPHNPFGDRMRAVKVELKKAGKRTRISDRLAHIAEEDSDGDGVANLDELLLGHFPGKKTDTPAADKLATVDESRSRYVEYRKRYPWEPFQPVSRPALPSGDFDSSDHPAARPPKQRSV